MNYFSKKVGLHTQIGNITQPTKRNITQLVGFHVRYGAAFGGYR
ncbi:hypothetical protein SAMN05444285_1111 [Draconibacterium orientale]|uniref:Uncharacterized protein n=1 Tax=Draconibacterium orientale TaxID=1168034 RepID=A0A1I0DNP5_9BACT|nr:hypothetical protein SAMN05444285_1111 [Draconibacterium orientale]